MNTLKRAAIVAASAALVPTTAWLGGHDLLTRNADTAIVFFLSVLLALLVWVLSHIFDNTWL